MGNIPSFIHISDGKLHDVHALDMLLPEAGAIYVVDRGYVDFARLYVLHQAGAFFVTRAKSNIDAHRVFSAPTDRSTGIICDQTISLDGFYTRQDYPELLRRIRFKDQPSPARRWSSSPTTSRFRPPPSARSTRWQVELFFKWISSIPEQFYGTSENAVKTQIWIAVRSRPRAIVKKRLDLDASLYTLLQMVTLFEKMPIHQALARRKQMQRFANNQPIEFIRFLTTLVGQGVKLEPDGIVAEPAARQPRPFDRVLAFLDVLLRFAALIVEGDHTFRRAAQVIPTCIE